MKRVFYGLMAGVLLCGAAYMVFIPGIKERSYYSGYDAGNHHGISAGTATGIEEGMAKMQAMQHERHEQDSLVAVHRHEQAIARARMRSKNVEKVVQNWHVIDDKIADPIPDAPTTTDKPAKTAPANG